MRVLSLLLAAALAAVGITALRPSPAARADEVTISGNNLRDGWDAGETTGSLTPATVRGGTFGNLFTSGVDGQVYAQPLVLDAFHELVVATENDWVYGLDSTSGAIDWRAYLPALVNPSAPGTPWPATTDHCGGLLPNIGVTSTPVYDPTANKPDGAVYLVSEEVPAGGSAASPEWFMHAIDPATGGEIAGWPVQIKGPPSNDPTVPFQPLNQLQRPGLLLTGGHVYAAFGSNCDFTPYDGYVVAVNAATRAQTMWTDEAGLTSSMAGIWQSGAGLMSDGTGRVFFTSGNGISPPPGPGSTPPAQLAESVVRLAMQGNGTLAAKDFFSPANAPHLDAIDGDLGSGGPVGLPFGTASLTDLLVQIGKDGRAFVLNATSLGGREQGAGGTDAAVSVSGPWAAGPWGHPAVFADTPVLNSTNVTAANDYVYFIAKNGPLFYLKAGLSATGAVTLSDVAQSDHTFGYTAGSPVVTSNGADPSSAVVWVVNTSDQSGATGTLEAFPAIPGGTCTGTAPASCPPLWSFPLTKVGKFTTPATDDGRVYIATRGAAGVNCPPGTPAGNICGQVLGFGSPSSAPLAGSAPAPFANVPVGTQSAPATVTVTASTSVSVQGPPATVGPGFAVSPTSFTYTPSGGSPTSVTAWPLAMSPGDKLSASVSFTPAAPGGATGALQFATDAANDPVVNVPLAGNGTQPGFVPWTGTETFTNVPVGTKTQVQLSVANDSTATEQLSVAAPAPAGPFSVTGPGTGGTPASVAPGTAVTLTVAYAPTAVSGGDSATLTLSDGIDPPATVSLKGTNAADVVPTLTPSPASVSFTSVPLGHQAQQVITVTNTGNLPATITGTAVPPLPFGTPTAVASGLPVNPGYSLSIPVTFTPTSVGTVSARYRLTWTDAAGTHTLTVPVTGTAVAAAAGTIVAPPPGGGWRFNGSARMLGTVTDLTQLATAQAGSADYSQPVASNGLTATFTVRLSGGGTRGGAGMTLSLLDATKTRASALGVGGRQLGYGGLPGVAIALCTVKGGSNYPSANFVGIATGVSNGQLVFAATATGVPNLRSGTHVIGVTVASGKITVTVDRTQYISKAVTVPPTVRLAFTGATSTTLTDHHKVLSATIKSGSTAVPEPGGGWSYNGASAISGPDTVLTPAVTSKAGTVIYPTALTAAGLAVTCNVQLSGGTGGDGITLALLNPTAATTAVGGSGPMLGLSSSLPGVYVVLGTDHTAPGWPNADFVALSTSQNNGALVLQSVAQGLSALRGGTHTVTVTVIKDATLGYVVTVWLDGVRMLQNAEPTLTPTVRLGFTAATGNGLTGGTGGTDVQIVRDVAASAP